jgi:hypothetical protein
MLFQILLSNKTIKKCVLNEEKEKKTTAASLSLSVFVVSISVCLLSTLIASSCSPFNKTEEKERASL